MKHLLFLFLTLAPARLLAESQSIAQFRGLNNSENAVLIGDTEAQSIQDVDITESGSGIKKRDGYAQFKTIGTSTWAVRGGYYFRDVNGTDRLINANNRSIFQSVSGGNYSSFVTTDTAGSYYDFTDSQGYLWRANNNRDEILRYDGSGVTYYPSTPKGDQAEFLPDRLVISGTSANPNRINFSKASDFTTFTTGAEEADAYTEDIGLPGQNINAIKVACGNNVLAWTRDSIFEYQGTNQYNGRIDQISGTIGTLQPNSVVQDYGVTYWQAQDKHFYAYDCNVVTKLSRKLDVSVFSGGESRQWEQNSQSDWQAGTLSEVNATISTGDIVLSTWTDTDTTTADFSAGTTSNTSVINNRVYLSTSNTDITNNSFETNSGGDPATTATGWDINESLSTDVGFTPTVAHSGTYSATINGTGVQTTVGFDVKIVGSTGVLTTTHYTPLTSFTQSTLSLASHAGRYIKIRFESNSGNYIQSTDFFLCSGENMTFYSMAVSGQSRFQVDLIEGGRSTIYSGTFTSAAFDTALSSPAWLASGANWTTNSHSITAQTQSSADGSSWETAVTWSTGSAPTSNWKRYVRYVVTLSTGGTTNGTALPYVDDVTFSARQATGTFVSVAKDIGGNATAFRNFTAADDNDGGTIAYFIRTATTEGGLASASYTALTKDAQITASINPWIQVKATFTITAATQDPTLSNFTVNWDEGTIVRSFGTVDKDHRLLWSIAEGTNTVPNSTYIYDPRFDSWLRYAVPFDAPARVGDSIYFGGVSTGVVYNWPSGDDDNGTAITAYWKSKDFVGADPFLEKDFLAYSLLAKASTGSNLDVVYTINTSSSVTVNHSLTDSNSATVRRINAHLPSGKSGSFINFQLGNNDIGAPFEIYGFRYDYRLRPWRVLQ